MRATVFFVVFFIVACWIFASGCEKAPAGPTAAQLREQQLNANIGRIRDRLLELGSDLPESELDDMRVLAMEFNDLTGDDSAVVLWAFGCYTWDQHAVGTAQTEALERFRSVEGGTFDDTATIEGIRQAKAEFEAAAVHSKAHYELVENGESALKERLEAAGLDDESIQEAVESWRASMDIEQLLAGLQIGLDNGQSLLALYDVLLEHEGEWSFDEDGTINGPDVVVEAFDVYKDLMLSTPATLEALGDSDR